MVKFLLFAKNELGDIRGLGSYEFNVPPRPGEFLTLATEGNETIYEVISIIHVTSNTAELSGNSGDMYLEPAKADDQRLAHLLPGSSRENR